MAITDFLSYVAEYAAIGVGLGILGILPIIFLPVVYIVHILLVFKKEYKTTYIFFMVRMVRGISFKYPLIPSNINKNFLFLIAANVGAVIMPFMLFYQTTVTAKKDYQSVQATKIETFVDCSHLYKIPFKRLVLYTQEMCT